MKDWIAKWGTTLQQSSSYGKHEFCGLKVIIFFKKHYNLKGKWWESSSGGNVLLKCILNKAGIPFQPSQLSKERSDLSFRANREEKWPHLGRQTLDRQTDVHFGELFLIYICNPLPNHAESIKMFIFLKTTRKNWYFYAKYKYLL